MEKWRMSVGGAPKKDVSFPYIHIDYTKFGRRSLFTFHFSIFTLLGRAQNQKIQANHKIGDKR